MSRSSTENCQQLLRFENDEPKVQPAGGVSAPGHHVQDIKVDEQEAEHHDRWMDLVRESKLARAAHRQQKEAKIEEVKRQAALVADELHHALESAHRGQPQQQLPIKQQEEQ